MQYFLLVFLWAAWGALHSLTASPKFIRRAERVLGKASPRYRLLYNLVAVGTFVPLFAYSNNTDTDLIISYSAPWNVLRLIMIVISLVLFLWSLQRFDGWGFLGIRPTASPTGMVADGPYRFVRHPMYLAAVILLWSRDVTPAGLTTNLALTIYIIIGCILEEKKLVAVFGDAYREYQQRVPMLLPLARLSK